MLEQTLYLLPYEAIDRNKVIIKIAEFSHVDLFWQGECHPGIFIWVLLHFQEKNLQKNALSLFWKKNKQNKTQTKTKKELIPCFLKQIIQWYEVVQTKLKVIWLTKVHVKTSPCANIQQFLNVSFWTKLSLKPFFHWALHICEFYYSHGMMTSIFSCSSIF